MKRFLCSVTVVALTALGSVALAETPKMHGRAALTFTSPNDNISIDGDDVDSKIDSALGLGLGWEYRFNDRIGLDLNWFYGKHDVSLQGRKFDSTKFMPVTVGANFHLTPDKQVDLFVGPVVGYVFYSDLQNGNTKVELDNDIVYGVNVGVEYPFKDKIAFFGSVKYLKASSDGTLKVPEEVPTRVNLVTVANPEVDVDPLVLQVGVSFRY